MNWNNVDLNSPYERAQNLLDPYSFDILLLEVSCNVKDIDLPTVREQALKSLHSKYMTALEILEANLVNITNQALKERAIQ